MDRADRANAQLNHPTRSLFHILVLSLLQSRVRAFVRWPNTFTVRGDLLLPRNSDSSSQLRSTQQETSECDVAIIGAGIGGLAAASILSAKYGLNVQVFESHYHAGGCAHSFPIKSKKSGATYQFDAGPTILLGCSNEPYNPLRQVLNFVGAGNEIDWISYNSWGMYTPEAGNWVFELGKDKFEQGPLSRFAVGDGLTSGAAGDAAGAAARAVEEFRNLRAACVPLCAGAAEIPTMALRGDRWKLLPLLRNLDALKKVIPYSDVLDGSFEPIMREHVRDPWLTAWIDALAFSLSGLPAAKTGAAALAYTLFDLHREGACLDYPRGGMGKIAETFVDVIERTGSEVHLKSNIDRVVVENGRASGVVVRSGGAKRLVKARKSVICNANVWALRSLLGEEIKAGKLTAEQRQFFAEETFAKEKTQSFLHLHLGLDSKGLRTDHLQPHYTIMDKGILQLTSGYNYRNEVDPCGVRNMVAVSNPSLIDDSLVDMPGKLNVHAYGAGNEPFDLWKDFASASPSEGKPKLGRSSKEYKSKKEEAAQFLYRSVARALRIEEAEVRERSEVALVGTPLTHERYLLRSEGTYGAGWGSMLPGPVTPLPGLLLAGDGVFPGIGVPAVCVSGASAANTVVDVLQHVFQLFQTKP